MAITISLPKLPLEAEFEEYVAACLQSCGYFIERSLIDRQEEELLELDIICTHYSQLAPPSERLIEVKSKSWGFADVFKLSGWGTYLGLEDLNLVVCQAKLNQTFYREKTKEIGVTLTHHPNNISDFAHCDLLAGCHIDPIDVATWRFSYWAERKLIQKLKDLKKRNIDSLSYRAIDGYYHTVNSAIFFSRNIVQRSKLLYDEYMAHPNLSARVGNESIGKNFEGDHKVIPDKVFFDTFYKSKITDVTLSTFVEHRARLALLKAAVDYCLFEQHGIDRRVIKQVELLGMTFSIRDTLPSTFLNGLERIRRDKYFHLYPVFWQTFLWLFGGFVLEDYRNAEYRLLSLKTGVPVDHIENALKAYETLFPTPGGWLKKGDEKSRITFLKMMPAPWIGIGAHYRKITYGANQDLKQLKLTGIYTENDLARNINALVELLKD